MKPLYLLLTALALGGCTDNEIPELSNYGHKLDSLKVIAIAAHDTAALNLINKEVQLNRYNMNHFETSKP